MPETTAMRDSQPAGGTPGAARAALPPLGRDPRASRRLVSVRYCVCLGLLIFAAGSMQFVRTFFEAYFSKERLELLRPLPDLRAFRLQPEYDLYSQQPEPLDHDLVDNLGTSEYLNWRLIDTRKDPKDRTYLARLFITYHTGQPDMVPHNPRECMQAGGWTLVEDKDDVVQVLDTNAHMVDIPVAVLDFVPPEADPGDKSTPRMTVVFFFYANGKYVTTRTGVRAAVQNLWDRYAYYSKIEISFTSEDKHPAGREASLEASRELLRKLMPVLWDEHFQDWEAIKAGAAPVQ